MKPITSNKKTWFLPLLDNSEAFIRLPSGTTWNDLSKIVEAKGNYSGLLIYVDNEIYKLLSK